MSLYNETFLNNAVNPLDIFTGVGLALSDQFLVGNLLLLSFFLIFLLFTFRGDFKSAIIADSFLTTILSIMLYTVGMVAAPIIAVPVILLFFSLLFHLLSVR